MRAGAMEIASQSRDASAEESAIPQYTPLIHITNEYEVPVDPMDDLHCDSCQ